MEKDTDIIALNTASGRGVIRADAGELAETLRGGGPETLLDSADILKDSRSTKAGIAHWPGEPERRPLLFVKRHNIKSAVHAAKYALRKPRAFREFRASRQIEALGLPTPKPLAALATRRAGLIPGPSYFIAEAVRNVVPTLDFLRDAFADSALTEEYVAAVTGFLSKLHSAGILHGDAKCSNFFVVRAGDAFSYGLWDLLSCRFRGAPVGRQDAEKEAARFADSLAKIAARLSMEPPDAAARGAVLRAYASTG